MATTRLEKALALPSQGIPQFFEHAVTLDKPAYVMPAAASSLVAGVPKAAGDPITLDDSDMQRFQLWQAAVENGVTSGTEKLNASPPLLAAMADFENYLGGAGYRNWATVDVLSRDAQYRLFAVDIGEAVNAKSTVPATGDSLGQSQNPIAPSDVGVLGGENVFPADETVVTGDPLAPDTVYGDMGSVVTVGG